MARTHHGFAVIAAVLIMLGAGPVVAQSVFFDPALSVPVAPEFTVDLYLATGGAAAMGLDVVFTYDPAIVQLDAVTAGDWFTTAPYGHFFWLDATAPAGTAHLSGAVYTAGRTVDGVAAVLHFTALESGISPLDFVEVTMRDQANADLGAGHSTEDEILIEQVIPVATISFGALKALWR